jgi:SAM-dependent methyltransferase
MSDSATLTPAIAAFDAAAASFDTRFGEWRSVAAQRRAVRRHLLAAFPPGARLLELAGGTAEDALFLAAHGRHVLLTDGAPAMVARARAKAAGVFLPGNVDVGQLIIEEIESFAEEWIRTDGPSFDGVYSNFAGLNCIADLQPVARGLARLLPEGAAALLVMFGPHPPGEAVVQLLRGDVRAAFRRTRRAAAPARLGGRDFHVNYPRPAEVAAAFSPWFTLRCTRGIGVFVPPSAAEPLISSLPRLLRCLEVIDRAATTPLARFGDHVLLHFVRSGEPSPAGSPG